MREIATGVERFLARGERVALATVVATRRSAPRPVGAKLAVSENGELAGSVSGGCVEADVTEHARAVLAGAAPRLLSYGIADDLAWSVGLPCGGEIDVFVERLDPEMFARARNLLAAGERAALLTVVEGDGVGERRFVRPGDDALADEALASGRSRLVRGRDRAVFCDVYAPPPRLVVVGAVDLAEALCALARMLGWRTTVVDPRPALATGERLPSADEVVVSWPDEVLAGLERDSAVVLLAHDEKLELPALLAALRSRAFYVGALGSRRAQERRRERLRADGVGEEELDRISGPCGLDLGAETTPETALSILAEIVAARADRSGGRLATRSGSIHAEAPA